MKNTNTKTQKRSLRSTGSFFNYLMSNNSSVPVVGKGATIMHWTDRSVAEVIEVSKDGKRVVIEHLNAKNIGKQFGEQDWEFSPSGRYQTIVWRNNAWRIEQTQVVFTKNIEDEAKAEDNLVGCYVGNKYPEISKEIYGGDVWPQNVVEGFTRAKKVYSKINILFGTKDYYYDYSF